MFDKFAKAYYGVVVVLITGALLSIVNVTKQLPEYDFVIISLIGCTLLLQ